MPSLWERRRRVKAASSTTIDHRADKVREAAAYLASYRSGHSWA